MQKSFSNIWNYFHITVVKFKHTHTHINTHIYLLVIQLEIRTSERKDLDNLSCCFQNVKSLRQIWEPKRLELSTVLLGYYSMKKRYMQRRYILISKGLSFRANIFNLYTESHGWRWWEMRAYLVAEMWEVNLMGPMSGKGVI